MAVLTLALATPSWAQTQAGEQGKDTEEKSDAQKSRGTGQDENIKNRSVKNDPANAPQAPPEKGGEKTRGALCYFSVDNRTPWKIQVFVDGDYVGLVPSWGNANGTYSPGTHVVYGLAEFSNGPDITWGPNSISCSGKHTWRLTDTANGYY